MGTRLAQGAGDKRRLVKEHVSELVATGALRRGSRVPSILDLAAHLDVAKNTVIAALDELCGEGVLEARERQGFYVRSARRREPARPTRLSDLETDRVAHGMASILVAGDSDFVGIGNGTTCESVLATPEWTATLKSAPPRDPLSSLRYADPIGEPHLREVIGARFGGTDDASGRVIITNGAIEGLNLAFAAAAARTGSRRIAVESPGYFMLGPVITALGLEPIGIPRRPDGLDLDRLRKEARRAPLAAVMINPNHQNPVGASLTLAERFELARLADERGFFVIEDDVYKGLWTYAEEPPSVYSLLPDRTLYLSSFSKTLGPGLRVGFVLAPDALLGDLRRRKFLTSLSGDAYIQNLVADFVDKRGYQKHLAQMREELGRRARIAKHQSEAFAQLGAFRGDYQGGLFWSFELREGIDVMALYRAAREKNVLVSPGCFFHVEAAPGEDRWMRVNVSRCEGMMLTRSLAVLKRALAKTGDDGPRDGYAAARGGGRS